MDSTPPNSTARPVNRTRCDRVTFETGVPTELRPSTPPPAEGRWQRWGRGLQSFAQTASVLSVLALSVVGGRYGHRWLVTTERFGARDVLVDGLTRTTEAEVLRVAGITPQRNVLSIDAERAAHAIETLPWVSHATVTRRLPGHVEVHVEERRAVALVAAGGQYLTDADGVLFKRETDGDPNDMPVITGIGREDFERDPDVAQEWVRDALALLSDVSASALDPRMRVEELHRDPTGELSLTVDGCYVWLGRGPYRAKLTRLRVVLAELRRRGIDAAEVHLESDRHPERVTVRPRRDS